ncbi:YqgE/AlgH family protein [Frigoriflavimonas asaccharolytica]|uniref:Putative transcriptional regulator n=1 Tax=Frigoriflavimonas asaccharolytica TaxID=2735899 RepID=A0A8J8G7C4_9FLAO|nr:YqgE/AlgH family protein [Frigoriflavimonas asaccharolytica]NRS92634.1 putative transcriptional regulator [Frigoriflavimonas asaccharolytica]
MSKSYKGKILISTPDISGDIFSRSVVLIIDHNEEGAFGLILNKKNKHVSESLDKILGYKVDIYEGGPVENDKVFYIVKGKPLSKFALPINEEYYLTEDSQKIIDEILNGNLHIYDVKVFSGYSGWAAKQLETEILNKSWTLVDVYNLDFTLPNDQNLWKNIMQNLGGEFLLWANAPEDVSLN